MPTQMCVPGTQVSSRQILPLQNCDAEQSPSVAHEAHEMPLHEPLPSPLSTAVPLHDTMAIVSEASQGKILRHTRDKECLDTQQSPFTSYASASLRTCQFCRIGARLPPKLAGKTVESDRKLDGARRRKRPVRIISNFEGVTIWIGEIAGVAAPEDFLCGLQDSSAGSFCGG